MRTSFDWTLSSKSSKVSELPPPRVWSSGMKRKFWLSSRQPEKQNRRHWSENADNRGIRLTSVTRLGYFLKFMAITFLTKVAQMIGYFLGYFGKWHYLSQICYGYFWDNYWKNWATLNSNIWSFCRWPHVYFVWFGCFAYFELAAALLVWSNPNQSNRRSAVLYSMVSVLCIGDPRISWVEEDCQTSLVLNLHW